MLTHPCATLTTHAYICKSVIAVNGCNAVEPLFSGHQRDLSYILSSTARISTVESLLTIEQS